MVEVRMTADGADKPDDFDFSSFRSVGPSESAKIRVIRGYFAPLAAFAKQLRGRH
jgi:hypothetical protein